MGQKREIIARHDGTDVDNDPKSSLEYKIQAFNIFFRGKWVISFNITDCWLCMNFICQ